MKNKIKILIGVAALVLATVTAQAQTNTPPTLQSEGSTALTWATTINTNYSFADMILWDGPLYENGVNIANELGASYDVWHSTVVPNNSTGTLFAAPEARFRQAGIAGIFGSESGGMEFGYMKGDFRIAGYVDGVYLQNPSVFNTSSRGGAEFGLQAEKLFTATGSGAAVFFGMPTYQSRPIIGASLTISFGTIGGFLHNIGL